MSRRQLARTPANFPRMKHRAAGRIARRQAAERMPSFFEAVAAAVRPLVDTFARIADALARIGQTIYQPAVLTVRPQDWTPAPRFCVHCRSVHQPAPTERPHHD
jgi:hypothetical protein